MDAHYACAKAAGAEIRAELHVHAGGNQDTRRVVMDVGPEVDELLGPPCQAAGELIAQGISHIAIFVSDEHPAPPAGPVSIDQILI